MCCFLIIISIKYFIILEILNIFLFYNFLEIFYIFLIKRC